MDEDQYKDYYTDYYTDYYYRDIYYYHVYYYNKDCLYDYRDAIYFCEIYCKEKRMSSDLRLKLDPELQIHLSKGFGYLKHEPFTTLFDSFFSKLV